MRAYLAPAPPSHFFQARSFSLCELQHATCPDLSSSETPLLGKGNYMRREKIYTCAQLHRLSEGLSKKYFREKLD